MKPPQLPAGERQIALVAAPSSLGDRLPSHRQEKAANVLLKFLRLEGEKRQAPTQEVQGLDVPCHVQCPNGREGKGLHVGVVVAVVVVVFLMIEDTQEVSEL